MTYILDTNMLIYYLNGALSQEIFDFTTQIMNQDNWKISIISKIELLGFKFESESDRAMAKRIIRNCAFIPVNETIADQAIVLRQTYRLKTPDAIIAATAIFYDCTLVSRNDKDFLNIQELNYFNPFL